MYVLDNLRFISTQEYFLGVAADLSSGMMISEGSAASLNQSRISRSLVLNNRPDYLFSLTFDHFKLETEK